MKLTIKGKLILVAALAVAGVGVLANSTQVNAGNKNPVREGKSCLVKWHHETDRAANFTTNGNLQTVKFEVMPKEGKETCNEQISFVSFQLPNGKIKPYLSQVMYDHVTKTYRPGVYTATVKLPTSATNTICRYQTDLVFGTHELTPGSDKLYGAERMIIANVDKCPEPAPGEIQVCDLTTKKAITIKETDFDAAKHSKDMSKCAEVLGAPTTLPSTGPAETIASMFGLGSLAAATTYYVRSRKNRILG